MYFMFGSVLLLQTLILNKFFLNLKREILNSFSTNYFYLALALSLLIIFIFVFVTKFDKTAARSALCNFSFCVCTYSASETALILHERIEQRCRDAQQHDMQC